MGQEWVTVKQLAQVRNCSERLIIKQIQSGKLTAKRDGKRWLIQIDDTESEQDSEPMRNDSELSELIAVLKKQLEEKDQQINQQQAIIMQLSRNQQLMLESKEQKQARQSWWAKLFTKGKYKKD